jgi:6-phosphogluconolactonase
LNRIDQHSNNTNFFMDKVLGAAELVVVSASTLLSPFHPAGPSTRSANCLGMPLDSEFANVDALANRVVTMVRDAIERGIAARDHANLIFSGGSTPLLFLPKVAALDLPWHKVSVTLADERWVSESSADSNTAMLKRILFDATAPSSKARFVPIINDAPTNVGGIDRVRVTFDAAFPVATTRYDLALLGMGNDAHFASLFPNSPSLAAHLSIKNVERVVAVPAPTTASPNVPRVTLTLAELSRSERIAIVMQGESKFELLTRARAANDAMTFPVSAVAALDHVEVLWCR